MVSVGPLWPWGLTLQLAQSTLLVPWAQDQVPPCKEQVEQWT